MRPIIEEVIKIAVGAGLLLLLVKSRRERAFFKGLAQTDRLTGLGNRRHFEEELKREFEEALRYNRPLSLLMIDLDHFKIFNDRYGHCAGDRQLQQFAKVLLRGVRGADLAARWGGEEFIVLLPQTGKGRARRVAERVHRLTETELNNITVSIGAAEGGGKGDTSSALIERADTALYQAKKRRNRVSVYSTPA